MKTGVYRIINAVNGKCYIGSASHSISNRWSTHKCDLRKGQHYNTKLQRAWNKYGEDCFVFHVLEYVGADGCIFAEQFWLDLMRPEYNILPTAGSNLGFKHKDATKEKMRQAALGRKCSEETKLKLAAYNTGRKQSEETIEKRRPKLVGHSVSAEARAKISAAHRGRKHTDITRENMSIAQMLSWGRKRGLLSG